MNHFLKLYVKMQTLKARKGQGVIEYAGAMVIATAIVAAVISVAPDALELLYQNIVKGVSDMLNAQLTEATT